MGTWAILPGDVVPDFRTLFIFSMNRLEFESWNDLSVATHIKPPRGMNEQNEQSV